MTIAANGPNPIVGQRSAEVRTGRSAIKRGLRYGHLTLAEVLADPPPCIHKMQLFTVLTWRRGWGRDKQRQIGALAIRDHVNLAIWVGSAGRRTLDWVIERDLEGARYPMKRAA